MTKLNPVAQQIADFQSELVLDERSEFSTDVNLRAIGKILHILGVSSIELKSADSATIQQLLELNDLYYRIVDAPSDLLHSEYAPLIVFDQATGDPLILTRQGGVNFIYSASKNQSWPLTPSLLGLPSLRHQLLPPLAPTAVEIFAPIRESVSTPFGLVGFVFSQQGLKAALWSLIACSLLIVLFDLLIPILTHFLVSRVLPQQDFKLLQFSALISLLIIFGLALVSYLQSRVLVRLQTISDRRMQSGVWGRVVKLPMQFIARFSAGDLTSRVLAINQLQLVLSSSVLTSGLQLVFSFAYFILMFRYDRGLAIWSLVFTLFSLLIVSYISFLQVRLQRPLQQLGADITNSSLQFMLGLQQIRSAGSEQFVLLRWLSDINRYALTQLKLNRLSDLQLVYASTVGDIGLMLMFVILTRRILNADQLLAVSAYIVAFLSFNSAYQSFNSSVSSVIQQVSGVIGQSYVLWERAQPALAADQEEGYGSDATVHDLIGHYRVRSVGLQFPCSKKPLFNDLSFEIQSGQHTAITGPTGSGKTTLIRLLLGFHQPDSGDVLVDDIALNKLAIRFYRRQVGVVMQSIHFGSGSIYNLIRSGLPIDRDKVWDCIEKAGFADEVNFLPLKLDTFISEGATNLSGGQRQKLAIARALVRDPKVLIMDEATSALDNRSQDRITEIVESMGITRVTVAHRLSTIQSANQVVVINEGQAIETGTPQELFASGGYLSKNLSLLR